MANDYWSDRKILCDFQRGDSCPVVHAFGIDGHSEMLEKKKDLMPACHVQLYRGVSAHKVNATAESCLLI